MGCFSFVRYRKLIAILDHGVLKRFSANCNCIRTDFNGKAWMKRRYSKFLNAIFAKSGESLIICKKTIQINCLSTKTTRCKILVFLLNSRFSGRPKDVNGGSRIVLKWIMCLFMIDSDFVEHGWVLVDSK